MLTVGEKLWNGATVTPSLAQAYNSIQSRIAGFQADGRTVPEYLLNGSHNLINSAPKDDFEAIEALRALDVPAISPAAIYEMRDAIAGLIISARHDIREYCDNAETRTRGNIQRHYVDSVALRLTEVTRP